MIKLALKGATSRRPVLPEPLEGLIPFLTKTERRQFDGYTSIGNNANGKMRMYRKMKEQC